MKQLYPAFAILTLLTLLTGVIYPLTVTALAQVVFPEKADGSLVEVEGAVIGSSLIGQNMNNDPRYFWSRPSAVGYNPLSSGGSNLASTSATLEEAVAQRAADFRAANQLDESTDVPAEMVFASGSGLDPHISPEAARLQIDRVANARNLPREQVADLVEDFVESPQLGFLGQPRVNVLLLNLALDELQ